MRAISRSAGSVVGAALLIIDLHTPTRFYNMLRIFRPTSPMSIGSYVLTSFGALSALLAAAQLRRDLGGEPSGFDTLARAAQIPAAVTGAAMSTYTGALLAATSTPLWAALPKLLPAAFGASAMASAAAALSLLTAGGSEHETLHRVELVASAVELVLVAMLPGKLRDKGIETRIGVAPVLVAGGGAAAASNRRGDRAASRGSGRRHGSADPPRRAFWQSKRRRGAGGGLSAAPSGFARRQRVGEAPARPFPLLAAAVRSAMEQGRNRPADRATRHRTAPSPRSIARSASNPPTAISSRRRAAWSRCAAC